LIWLAYRSALCVNRLARARGFDLASGCRKSSRQAVCWPV
jgi:hypothetical protein